jgi:uncharacterized protein YgiM (DUF1202 family)
MTASQRQGFLSLWFTATFSLLAACSDSDQKSPQEPVAAATDSVSGDSAATESGAGADAAAIAPNDTKENATPREPVAATSEQGEQPLADSEPVPEAPFDGEAVAVDSSAPAPFQEGDLDEGSQANEMPVDQSSGSGHRGHKHKAKGAKHGKFSKGKATRYVKASTLNVRSKPSLKASVVRKLQAGEVVRVVAKKGKWVKIAKGQWVQSKFLSPKAPGG